MIRDLFLQAFDKVRFAKASKIAVNTRAALDGLTLLDQLKSAADKKTVTAGEAEKLRKVIVNSIGQLFDIGDRRNEYAAAFFRHAGPARGIFYVPQVSKCRFTDSQSLHVQHGFANHASEIAEACRIGDERLGHIVGKSGQPPIDWYAEFTDVLKFIAAKNNIKPTISTNPVTLKRQGRFLDLATAFERLLPLAMRSETDEARAQRLKRALRHN